MEGKSLSHDTASLDSVPAGLHQFLGDWNVAYEADSATKLDYPVDAYELDSNPLHDLPFVPVHASFDVRGDSTSLL